MQFSPARSLIVSLDYDHADVYKTKEDYNDAFRQFIDQSGQTILWRTAAEQLELESTDENSTILDGKVPRDEINLVGGTMRMNAKLVLEMLREVLDDFNEAEIKKILADFPGTSRRFEKLFDNLYTDYAHAPAEIAATLERARETVQETGQKIVAVYQPHQNLRQTEIAKEGGYSDSFNGADKIYWVPTYLVRGDLVESAPAVLSSNDLIKTLSESVQEVAKSAELDDNLWKVIQEHLANNDLVIIMGAGPIDNWLRDKLFGQK